MALAGSVVLLLVAQNKLIYHPRRYPATQRGVAGTVSLEFRTSQGAQRCYWMAPRKGPGIDRVWVVFGGNAFVAAEWTEIVSAPLDPNAGFLLVEYPGYGASEGSPSPASILEASEGAVRRLREHGVPPDALDGRLLAMGHSLGAAAALQLAVHHRVRGVVLLAPFTTMVDMARRVVGWPLCHLVRHRWDNRARLSELLARPGTWVAVLHGADDTLIPPAMGRTLAAEHPGRVFFHAVAGADHMTILERTDDIRAAMSAVAAASTAR